MTDPRGIVLKKEQVELIREMYPYHMPNGYVQIPESVQTKVSKKFPSALHYIGNEQFLISRYQHNGRGKVWGVILWNLRWPLEYSQAWMLVGHFGHQDPIPLSRRQIQEDFCDPIVYRIRSNMSRLFSFTPRAEDAQEYQRREACLQYALA